MYEGVFLSSIFASAVAKCCCWLRRERTVTAPRVPPIISLSQALSQVNIPFQVGEL